MILVTGVTGLVGGEVFRQLVAAHESVRGMARNVNKALGIFGSGSDVVYGDLDKPESLDSALRGIERVFLVSPSQPDQVRLEGNMAEAAKRAGIRHLVKLSVMGASPFTPINLVRWHWQIERLIDETGVPATYLRPHFFMQNTLMHAPTIATEGRIYASLKSGKINQIDVRDIAAVAATVLTEQGHEGKGYDLTGPEALTYPDVARKIADATGRPVEYVSVPEEAVRDAMRGMEAEDWLAEDLINYLRYFEQGLGGEVTGNVTRIAGRPLRTFDQFARDYADVFRGGSVIPRAA